MVGASFERFIALLDTIDQVRSESEGDSFRLRLNYTVSAENVEELGDFFQVLGHYHIDTIQLRPIIDLGYETYSGRGLEAVKRDYQRALDRMQVQCERRGVSLLYNDDNTEYSSEKARASVYLDAVLRLVRPGRVWDADLDWPTESPAVFKRRTGFRLRLLRYSLGLAVSRRPETQFNTSKIL